MTESVSSLETARAALGRADAAIAGLLERPAGPGRDAALGRALTERARAWRLVAWASFDDVVGGDLLGRRARPPSTTSGWPRTAAGRRRRDTSSAVLANGPPVRDFRRSRRARRPSSLASPVPSGEMAAYRVRIP